MSSRNNINTIRNIGIMAHIDAGKTTLTERILFATGRIHSMGNVHDGKATMDYLPQERDRGITITSAATTTRWSPRYGLHQGKPHRITILDTPGHVDFTMEVERSLRVLDGAVAVFDASEGVEPQSETVWRQAERHCVPRIAFVNKMDKVGADFGATLRSMRTRLGANVVALQLPVGEGAYFRGIVDVIRMRLTRFGQGYPDADGEIPVEMREPARLAHQRLVEACADVDEDIMRKYVDGTQHEVDEAALRRALRTGTLRRTLVPVLCGAAARMCGVVELLDAVVGLLPAPSDVLPVVGHHPGTDGVIHRPPLLTEPFTALVFKLTHDRSVGSIAFLRVYSGALEAGSAVFNATQRRVDRMGRMMFMHAKAREEVSQVQAGDICAALGLKGVRCGDTLTLRGHPVVLEPLSAPPPVVEMAVHPQSRADTDKLGTGLQKIAAEDPSLLMSVNAETGQTLLKGMGELHLEIVVDRLRTEHGVAARLGAPRVAYRETLVNTVVQEYRHVHQNGGVGQFAHVIMEVGPASRAAGLVFINAIKGGVIPQEFIPAVERGVAGAMARGVLLGYPMVDVLVRLLDGSAHSKDSSAMAFATAGSMAFQHAARRRGVQLLEPVMAVEVEMPSEFLGPVLADLGGRSAKVRSTASRSHLRVVHAEAPLAKLFGYVGALRGFTRGRGTAHMQLLGHAPMPAREQAALTAEHA